jgi:hypothetical protein
LKPDELRRQLCSAFCIDISVHEVPAGLAISAMFQDDIGDKVGAYLIRDTETAFLADDGSFLAELDAAGIDVRAGSRAQFLERVLAPAGAFVDPETLEIRTPALDEEPSPARIIEFLSALARVQDIKYWTQERIRSTFIEDATAALTKRFLGVATIHSNAAVDERMSEFPADLVIRPQDSVHHNVIAVFLAQTLQKLDEALLFWHEARSHAMAHLRVAALVEDLATFPVQSRKAQRTFNRIDATAFYRQDEAAAVEHVARMFELVHRF